MNKIWMRNLLVVVTTAIGTVVLLSCTGPVSNLAGATPSAEDVASQAILSIADLPQDWRKGEVKSTEIPGVTKYTVGFHGTRDPGMTWVNIGQEIYIYSNQDSAITAYEQLIPKEFPVLGDDGWQHAPELEFRNQADQLTTACLPVRINNEPVTSCRTIARYRNMIVVIRSNLYRDRWVTIDRYRKVLESMDQRAIDAVSLSQ